MKKALLLFVFALFTIQLSAQEKAKDTLPNDLVTVKGRQRQPQYPGGLKKFSEYIMPKIQRSPHFQRGKIVLTFIVEKDGSISNVKLVEGINEKFDERVREIIANSPKWIPGEQDSKPIRTSFRVPLVIN